MPPIVLSPEQQTLVDGFAVQMESFGIPPLAARIFGVLLFVDPPEKCTQDIIALTGGSKGAISLMLRMMEQLGLVEKCPIPERRGHGWRLTSHFMMHMIEHKLRAISSIQEFLQLHQDLVVRQSETVARNVQELLHFHQFLYQEINRSFEIWKQQIAQNEKNTKVGKGVS